MTIEQIRELVAGDEYKFLRTEPRLAENLILVALGGSYAYGTNVEFSDIDIRGSTLNSRCDLIGLSSFEQYIDSKTDTTIYGFNKLIKLLINCNPNVIEILGLKPEHYLFLNSTGELLINNRKLFLSQKAVHSFGGYANQQLKRLKNAFVRQEPLRVREDSRINKHAMHLVRLYLMGIDILEKEEIITYREHDKELLLEIRNGAFQNEDGTYKDEFFMFISCLEKQLNYAIVNTSLPIRPNMKRIEELVMSVNEGVVVGK